MAGTDTGVEQAGFQEDLAVSDRNHVGWHESRHVTGLRFNDGQAVKEPVLPFTRLW
jgi:hypothetical protein